MNQRKHEHVYKVGPYGKMEVCKCGRFRPVNLDPADIIKAMEWPTTKRQAMSTLLGAQNAILHQISFPDEDGVSKWQAIGLLQRRFDQIFHSTNMMREAD